MRVQNKKFQMRKILLFLIAGLILIAGIYLGANYHNDLDADQLRERYAYPEDSGFIEVDGMLVHYRSTGKGAPVILLHGTASSLHTWEGWTAWLASYYRVISLDLPAFGLTGPHPARDYSIAAYSDFLEQFVAEQRLDTFYLAGNSLGGLIAWQYAADHPERVRKLILLDAAGFPREAGKSPLAIRLAQNKLLSGMMTKITPKSLLRKSLLEVYADDSKVTDALLERYFELLRFPGNRQAYVDRVQEGWQADIEGLRTLDMPVLIQWGGLDAWIPVGDAHRFKEYLQHAELIVYPDLGHVPMEEAPERTVQDALRFFWGIP